MTVAELIKELRKHPGTRLVVQSRDEEGNGFSPTYEVSPGCYDMEGRELIEGKENAVVLWPTH